MPDFLANLESIKDAISEEHFNMLSEIAKFPDSDDNLKRLAIAILLEECGYNGSLDWLYSTLREEPICVIRVIRIVA